MRLLKFGGTSVGNAAAFKRAVQIVRALGSEPVVVVVSAMSGMTDALISADRAIINQQLQRHLEVADVLDVESVEECHALIQNSGREIVALLDASIPERPDLSASSSIKRGQVFTYCWNARLERITKADRSAYLPS